MKKTEVWFKLDSRRKNFGYYQCVMCNVVFFSRLKNGIFDMIQVRVVYAD